MKKLVFVAVLVLIGVVGCNKNSSAEVDKTTGTAEVNQSAETVSVAGSTETAEVVLDQETRTLDGVQYIVIDPVTYAFNADTGRLRVGERYVIDDQVFTINGARLYLQNTGAANRFILDSPLKLSMYTNITVYVQISDVGFWVEANVIKVEVR